MQGYIQIYTGNGKGKTTAAIGLAVRALGSGLQVYIGQFVKDMAYAEVGILEQFSPQLTIEQLGVGCFIDRAPEAKDVEAVKKALAKVTELMKSERYDLIILDEIFIAHYFKLLTTKEILTVLDEKPTSVEIVLTGRYAPVEIVQKADLVTEMLEVRHYYTAGVNARDGIER